jgi:hypothetical protein
MIGAVLYLLLNKTERGVPPFAPRATAKAFLGVTFEWRRRGQGRDWDESA